jgi:uncharacterized membrane protein YfcA
LDIYYIFAGASVGFVIGITGVGGGSLMTPLLVLGFQVQPAIAVGTDLLYAAITKAGGVYSHQKFKNIDWTIAKNLCLGSIPASIVSVFVIQALNISDDVFAQIISLVLGIMLVCTSIVIIFKQRLIKLKSTKKPKPRNIIILGACLGVLVTISSVGAGAIGSAILLILYPKMLSNKVVGTDIAHAVPLTAIAGLGHLHLGNIDFNLLTSLIIGSLPAVYLGTKVGKVIPDKMLKYIIATILMLMGLRFAISF